MSVLEPSASSLCRFTGELVVNPELPKLPFLAAASSATREERAEVSISAEEVEAVSIAARAAAVAFLFSSSVDANAANEVAGLLGDC